MGDDMLKREIMRQVRAIFWLRRVINYFTIKVYALALLGLGLVSTVSMQNVFANMPPAGDIVALLRFMFVSIANTEVVVQVFVAAGAALFVLFVIDIVRHGMSLLSPRPVRI